MKLLKYILIAIVFAATTGEAFGQAKVLSGKVTEMFGTTAEPMIGVNVNILNSQNRSLGGTVTNLDGIYNLPIPNENNLIIVFSYIGKKSERIKYNGQTRLNVVLKDDTQTINEVVVQGKRIERNDLGISAREQSSATQKVSMEDLVAVAPVTSIEDALQGQLGGVDIVLGGGDPGARASIQIRGGSTLNANAEPLIVVDGVPYPAEIDDNTDFSTINNDDLGALLNISPQDIESIEVLKDAAATAVWGTSGANGVLVIKTKQGVQGKTRFSFSSKFSAKFEPETIPMLNGNQYSALVSEALWNSANYIGLANSTSYLQMLYGSPEIGYQPDWTYFDEYNQNTDWLSEVRRNTQSWENTFSMSGGGERATYRFSLGYLDEGGTTVGTDFSRLNSSLNVNYKFSDKLNFYAQFSYTQSERNNNYYNVRGEAFRKAPNKSPYYIDDETGNRTSQYFNHNENSTLDPAFNGDKYYNPIAMANESVNRTIQRESKMNFRIKYDILNGLTYEGYVNMNIRNTKGRMFLPQVATGLAWTDKMSNRSTDTSSDLLTINTENKLMYRKNWNDKHAIIATAVFRTTETNKSSYGSETSGNVSSGLADPTIGSAVRKISSGDSKTRNINGVALMNYTLLNRYIINASLGMESNSTMGKSERFGMFPTVGLAWHLADEKFMDFSNDWMDEFKLRFSLGQTGNSASGASLYLGSYASGNNYMDMSAITPSSMQLNKLKWETTTEFNFGLDFGFFNQRLSGTFEYFKKEVKDLLGYRSLKSFMEVSTVAANIGKTQSTGIEISLKSRNFTGEFKWDTELNFTRYVDRWKERNPEDELSPWQKANDPIRAHYGYLSDGVLGIDETPPASMPNLLPGEYKIKDVNGYLRDDFGNLIPDENGNVQYTDAPDGIIDEADIVLLGTYDPGFSIGFGNTFEYKGFDLNIFFYGMFDRIVNNATRGKFSIPNIRFILNGQNMMKEISERWSSENPHSKYPSGFVSQYPQPSDYLWEDAWFIRCKNITLGYTLPQKWIRKVFSRARIFADVSNPFVITPYSGNDPETDFKAGYPNQRTYSFGVDITF